MMKYTPFTEKHIALGAKMAGFAGYYMPIHYSGINDEHAAVRNRAGIFDVSHMGEFLLEGDQALDLVQRVTSNDASKLVAGRAQYSCLPNDSGGIVDDLLVYCLEAGQLYMLVVNAGNIARDWEWICQHNVQAVAMTDISDRTCLLAVQGPAACRILQSLTSIDLLNLPYYHFREGSFAGVEQVLISATGYTGAGGVELYFENKGDNAAIIWAAILAAGAGKGLQPIGLGARDTLRLEMGFCLYGNDIDETTSPIAAGLGWITKGTKDFPSRAIFEAEKAVGVSRRLAGFELSEKGIARHDHLIKDMEGGVIGRVSSGTQSPTLGKAIGMGYIDTAHAFNGSEIYIDIRNRLVKACVVKMPFV